MIRGIFKRNVGFILLSVILAGCGVFLSLKLPVMMYPQTQRPQVSVRISHPGLSALDFQKSYSARIESGLLAVSGLELLSSTYSSDSSSYDLLFDWKVKSLSAKSAVESAMTTVNASLPEELKGSWQVRYRESENAGFLILGVLSDIVNPEKIFEMLVAGVEPELVKLVDAEDVSIFNVEELKADITLKQEVMLSYGITINDVNQALQSGFSLTPLGRLREGDQRFTVRHLKKSGNLDSLYRLEIKRAGSSSVSLDDIAVIDIRYTVPRQVFLVGSRPAVQLTATPIEGGNLTRLSSKLMGIMESAKKDGRLPADSEFVFYLDPAKYINRSIDNVAQSALLGGALAILIVFIILGELRNTLIIALSLPISILLTFIPMYFFGMSLNLISLGGLALAVGMIVDATIVVTENIHRWRFEALAPLTAPTWMDIVVKATAEVQSPVISSTLTSVLVFLPISFTAPLANAILGDQARTVVFSLMASLIVSLTIVPLIAWMMYRSPRQRARAHEPPRGLGWLSVKCMDAVISLYRRMLRSLIKRKTTALLFLAASFSALGLCLVFIMPSIPKELLSTPQSDRIVLLFRNAEITDTVDVMEKVVPDILARIDSSLGKFATQSFVSLRGQFNQVFIDLADASKNDEAQKLLEKEFVSQGSWYFNIMSWDPAALPLPISYALQISIFGPEAAKKVEILDGMQRLINQSGLYRRAFTRPSPATTNELILESRPDTMGSLSSWSESNLLALTRRILSGTSSTTLAEGQTEISVSARYPDTLVDSREKLENFLIPWKNSFIPLKHFFNFKTQIGISQIYAENGELVYRLYANMGPGSTDAQMAKAKASVKELLDLKLKLPEGYSWAFDNPRKDMDDALSSLFVALAISVVLMYLLLAWQFNSLVTPLVILVTIPLGLIGVILSLKAFGSVINLNSLLGMILLGGIVVNNAIIMIDFYENSQDRHGNLLDALIHTAGIRFQPILITTLTTIIGMLPLAIGLGSGSNILKPLGIAVSGGLTVSTILTLFAVPALIRLGMKGEKIKNEGKVEP